MRKALIIARKVIGRAIADNLDLVLLAWILTAAQALVPVGHFLSRPDLLPWTCMAMVGTMLLRRGGLGDGPHPMLTARESSLHRSLQLFAQIITPFALMGWFDASWTTDLVTQQTSIFLLVLVVLARWLGSDHGLTSWDPPSRIHPVLKQVLGGGVLLGVLSALGTLQREVQDDPLWGWAPAGAAIGCTYLALGLVLGRSRDVQQRRAAGRVGGRPYIPNLFRPMLALVGPSVGYWILMTLYTLVMGGIDFNAAFVVSVYVVTWAALLWPRQTPVAMHCVLYEVVPTGGKDRSAKEQAASFERPPEGALRLNPLDVRRTRKVHTWVVPVKDARIGGLDDPVRPLWARATAPHPFHSLGDSAFEQDPDTMQPQSEVLTIRMRGQRDVGGLGESAQVRRIVVLRAWPKPGQDWKKRLSTWRWEEPIPEASLQVVDASTEKLQLQDGSILVVSVEGVARAYELEIGAPIFRATDVACFRPPQMEDYVGLR